MKWIHLISQENYPCSTIDFTGELPIQGRHFQCWQESDFYTNLPWPAQPLFFHLAEQAQVVTPFLHKFLPSPPSEGKLQVPVAVVSDLPVCSPSSCSAGGAHGRGPSLPQLQPGLPPRTAGRLSTSVQVFVSFSWCKLAQFH